VFPYLLDIVNGGSVGGIAFGQQSAAGEIWSREARPQELDRVEIVGASAERLLPTPSRGAATDPRFDRQARMFGAEGQEKLRDSTVAIVGLGGGGSMVLEQLAHLGIGQLLAVDYDVVKTHNLSRVMGATHADAASRRKKVDVAGELVQRIDPSIRFRKIDGDLSDTHVAHEVSAADFIFLCTDTITSRFVANAIVHSHFIPMIQIGAKVDLRKGGAIESIYVAVRPVFPGYGCLVCAGLIDPVALQREAATEEERRAQNYLGLPEVVDPSVVTLNGVAASVATNLMLMSIVGLATDDYLDHRLFDAQRGSWLSLKVKSSPDCRWCGGGDRSTFGRGSTATLPVRLGQSPTSAPRPSLLSRFFRHLR
jgi:molybdopterin/thiamine biosynthesis adenylyltransferase